MTKKSSLHDIINELVSRTNTDTQRIRALEQSNESLVSRLESAEKELIALSSAITKMNDGIEAGFKKRDATISELQSTIKEMIKHLKRTVTRDEFKEVESMMDIYSPLKSNFATKEEVEQLIKKALSKNNK